MKQANATENMANSIRDVMSILKSMPADMISLVMVETQLFGSTALAMLKLCVVIGLLLVAGWLFTSAAAVIILEDLSDIGLLAAVVIVALSNLGLAALLILRLRYIARDLTFRESRSSVNTLLAHARTLVDNDAEEQSR